MARNTPEGKVQYYWADSIADASAPTVAEMTAAVKIGCEIAGFPSLAPKAQSVATPDLCSNFETNIPGVMKVDDTTVQFYLDDASTGDPADIRAAIVTGAEGFIVRVDAVNGAIPAVATAGTKVDVHPVRVSVAWKDDPTFGGPLTWSAGLTFPAKPEPDASVVA